MNVNKYKPNQVGLVNRLAELMERRAKGYHDISVPFSEEDEEEIDQILDLQLPENLRRAHAKHS